MEEGGSVAEFKFLTEPDDGLKCLICLGVAREPLQHEACGRLFCKECLDKHGRQKPCPNCRQRDSHYYEDKRSRRVIQDLAVCCQNVDRSCEWQGTVDTLQAHLTTCQFALIQCPKECGEQILREDVDEHVSQKCWFRNHECPLCGEAGTYVYITLFHEAVCSKKIVSCSSTGCQQTMQQCEIEKHVESVCDYTVIPCKYENFGCGVRMERRHMKAHEDDDKLHLCMSMATTLELKEKVSKLESSLQEATRNIAVLMQKFEEQQLSPQASLETTLQSVKTSITHLQNKVNVFSFVEISKFTVFQYEKKRRTRKTYTSQSFYTCYEGYNLAIEIDANGEGIGKGTHLSVSMIIKPGRNDERLLWPFLGRLTVILLNQLEDKNHHAQTAILDAADDLRVGEKSCFQKFIHQSDLNYNAEKNTQYLMHDTLHFRVCLW